MAKQPKLDIDNSEESKNKAEMALRKVKAMEEKYKKKLRTIVLPNGTEITANKKELLNDYQKHYAKL